MTASAGQGDCHCWRRQRFQICLLRPTREKGSRRECFKSVHLGSYDLPVDQELDVVGWVYGFRKIDFTHLLMSHCSMWLADAKHTTDDVLVNRPVRLTFPSTSSADAFHSLAEGLGAKVARTERPNE